MISETTIKTYDGLSLYARADTVANPRATVVIVHGLAEHLNRYDYLTTRLNAQGYSVYRFDHRGHGRSEGQRCHYERFDDIAKDVDAAVDWAQTDSPAALTFVIGHSMGGYATTMFATQYPGKVNGIILSGAVVRDTIQLMKPALETDAPDLTYVSNSLGDGVCSDPEVCAAYEVDPLVSKEFTLGLMRRLHEGCEYLEQNAKQFVEPALLMHGLNDGLVWYRDSLLNFEQIGSTDKSLRVFSGMMHEIFNEFDKDDAIQTALDWLDAHCA